MAQLDKRTKERLINEWLPRVRELKKDRRPIFLIMLCAILLPLIFSISLLIYKIIFVDVIAGGICALFLGVTGVAFVYAGRLQSCNDIITAIELAVYVGRVEEISKAISYVACFGKMQDLIRDLGSIMKWTAR